MGFTTKLIKYIYHSPLAVIFPTAVRQLQNDLKACPTVLDFGCGLSSPLEYVKTIWSFDLYCLKRFDS